jgi:hypothetical protein
MIRSQDPSGRPITISPPDLRGRLAFAWRAGGPTNPARRALVSLATATLPERDSTNDQGHGR